MAHASFPVSRGYLLAGAAVAAGLYATRDGSAPVAAVEPEVATVSRAQTFSMPTPPPALASSFEASEPAEPEQALEEIEVEGVHGHAQIDDAAEFAMVFEVGGTSYLRLSTALRAKTHGKPRMVVDGGEYSVVAAVAASALPAELTGWSGRTVLVNGECHARVIGFAEISRAAGEPPGMEEYWGAPENERPAKEPTWTLETVMSDEPMLAAKLDGCSGTWARSTDYQPAQIARFVNSPGLEADAISDLLSVNDNLDPVQDSWKEMGGEGDWRDAVDIDAKTFEHPTTGEKWIFASAFKEGHCGDPSVSKMAAYRVGRSGAVQRFTDLEYAGETIQDVVDLDGDGQPELVLGSGSSASLVDLTNNQHESIEVPYHTYGCGC